MNAHEFEGTLILEKLARIDKVDEFMEAIDSEDIQQAKSLMKSAGIDDETIAIVLRKIVDPDDSH